MNIQLPQGLKNLTQEQRAAVIEELRKALDVEPVKPAAPPSKNTEHNIWLRNDDEFLADAEEDFYNALISPTMHAMAEVIAALGLSHESIEKSLSDEFMTFEDTLIKGKGGLKTKVSELMELSKKKRQAFLKYLEGASNWTKKKLKEIDRILSQKLPDADKLAEEYAVRAAFISKIRNQADTEALEMAGAFVDRFPKTIEAARHETVVVNQHEKKLREPKTNPNLVAKPQENTSVVVTFEELEAARKEWNRLKVLPLQPQELKTVEQAELRTAEKITEVRDRHKAAIKQVVLQAINGRWSSQKLAQELFDKFGDMNRDWRRIAITELSMAHNDAYLSGLSEGDTVTVPTVAGACKYCQSMLEGKTFIVTKDPKLMGHNHEQEMKYVWIGKTNYGRTVSTWLPCVPLHPNCRHRYHKLSRFYQMDTSGKPALKPVHQLIQEERLRRGLGLDPNLPPI